MNTFRVDVSDAYWFLIHAYRIQEVREWVKENVPEPESDITVCCALPEDHVFYKGFDYLTLDDSLLHDTDYPMAF